MKRLVALVLLIAVAAPASAEREPPYYGPGKHWHGIGYKFGYEDHVEKDGSWRIDARVRRGEAINMAMYRAAERARDAGYRYVQFLRGTVQVIVIGLGGLASGRGTPTGLATVWARPAATPDAPAPCPRARIGSCYTADVATVLRVLGGPDGTQPGVAIVDHQDQFGRSVMLSGFGVGATNGRVTTFSRTIDGRVVIQSRGMASSPVPPGVATAVYEAPPPPMPFAASARPGPSAADAADARFEAARRAEQPTRSDPRQGWTVSD